MSMFVSIIDLTVHLFKKKKRNKLTGLELQEDQLISSNILLIKREIERQAEVIITTSSTI